MPLPLPSSNSAKNYMPIIEPAIAGEPLAHGDLLRGVKLYITSNPDNLKRGEPESSKEGFCLVLSRPCVVAHKKTIIVAAVASMPAQTPSSIDTFDKALNFLIDLRDGGSSPDVFYLGQVTGFEGRFAARFDSLHTLGMPKMPVDRQAFVDEHRIAKLHFDFVRSLHTRFFQAISSLGFDDVTWFSTADLRYLIQTGRSETDTLKAKLSRLEAAQDAGGVEKNAITSCQKQIATLETQMAAYLGELDQRNPVT